MAGQFIKMTLGGIGNQFYPAVFFVYCDAVLALRKITASIFWPLLLSGSLVHSFEVRHIIPGHTLLAVGETPDKLPVIPCGKILT